MRTSYRGDAQENTRQRKSLSLYLGLLPVLLFIVLLIGSHRFLSSVRVYEPALLLPLLNTFLCLAAGVIAYLALRIYLISGSPTILWIGCGVLTLGLGALAAGWLIIPYGPNVNVTIFSVGVLLASICHIGAAVANLEENPGEADPSRRKQKVWLAYLAAPVLIALLAVLTVTGLTPPFFIQGQGPTVIRQNVAGWAIVLFVISSLFTMNRFRRKGAAFLYWYSLALALLASPCWPFFCNRPWAAPWVGPAEALMSWPPSIF